MIASIRRDGFVGTSTIDFAVSRGAAEECSPGRQTRVRETSQICVEPRRGDRSLPPGTVFFRRSAAQNKFWIVVNPGLAAGATFFRRSAADVSNFLLSGAPPQRRPGLGMTPSTRLAARGTQTRVSVPHRQKWSVLHRQRVSVPHRQRVVWATSRDGAQLIQNLFLGRESSLVILREDLLVPDSDVEDSSAAADDRGVDLEFLLDLSRQTGGSGKVVSNAAVFDRDLHGRSSSSVFALLTQPRRERESP